jgi:hypothetical protein
MNSSRPGPELSNAAFIRVLSQLEPHLPISDAYERDLPQKQGSWWTSQREHMLSWFRSQGGLGSGQYTRSAPNASARTTYNRLASAPALIWMAEALGEDAAVVQEAADAARSEPNTRKRPGLIRKYLPWPRIEELASRKL